MAMRFFWPPEPAAGRMLLFWRELLRLGKDACVWPPEAAACAGAAVLRAHDNPRALRREHPRENIAIFKFRVSSITSVTSF
jgi:hypothetical protein